MTRTAEDRAASLDRAAAVARILDDKKARDILVLDVGELCSFADGFVIATAENITRLRALEHIVYVEMRARGVRARRDAIQNDSSWVILDYGDVVVHLFLPEARTFYRLENLWGDAPSVEWASRSIDTLRPTPANSEFASESEDGASSPEAQIIETGAPDFVAEEKNGTEPNA